MLLYGAAPVPGKVIKARVVDSNYGSRVLAEIHDHELVAHENMNTLAVR